MSLDQQRYSQAELDRERRWGLRYGHINGLAEAARDICMYCGGRAPAWTKAEGPNEAGNWTHSKKASVVLCAASSVQARLAHLVRESKPEPVPERIVGHEFEEHPDGDSGCTKDHCHHWNGHEFCMSPRAAHKEPGR